MNKEHSPIQWTLPMWAADLIRETIALDSRSGAFDPSLRQELSEALDEINETDFPRELKPSSTINPPMSTIVLKFNPSGLGECLYTEIIDLSSIGSLEVHRASTIEFNQDKQEWEVRDRKGALLFSNKSRAVCLAWEQQHFNH